MLTVDLPNRDAEITGHTSAVITLEDVLDSEGRGGSDATALARFLKGFPLEAGLAADERWHFPSSASSDYIFLRVFLHEIVPETYDVRHLETLGRCFSLRLTGVGDFSVIAFNRRVVTLSGAPLDWATKTPVVDVEIRPDIFLAVCNALRAAQSTETLQAVAARARDHLPMGPTRTSGHGN